MFLAALAPPNCAALRFTSACCAYPQAKHTKTACDFLFSAVASTITHVAHLCIPGEYEFQQQDRKGETRAKIMPGHVRAFAHRFYAGGADGL
jgi:hypothetical protein